MSSSEATRRARPARYRDRERSRLGVVVRALGLAAVTVVLVGCESGSGFRPLYGSLGNGADVERKMAQIEIGTIPGRNGQRIRNELIFQTTGGAAPLPPAYRLEMATKELSQNTLIARDGNSAGAAMSIEAKFQLIRLSDKKVMLEGVSIARATFERFSGVYSNVRANDDNGERAAKTIATDVKSRLAAFLSSAT